MRGTERAWNWCGAVLHWIYFCTLPRKSWSAWNQTVWWLSLIALLTSVAGTWLGIQRTRHATWATPRGRRFGAGMKWHHVMGLFASVIVLFWMLSGWLSMDHGRLFSKGGVSRSRTALSGHAPGHDRPRSAARTYSSHRGRYPKSVLERSPVAQPVAARGGSLICPKGLLAGYSGRRAFKAAIDASLLVAGPGRWLLPHVKASRRMRPLRPGTSGAVAESLGDAALPSTSASRARCGFMRDSVTGQVLVVMDTSRRAYAWVYYALHTLNFPGLSRARHRASDSSRWFCC